MSGKPVNSVLTSFAASKALDGVDETRTASTAWGKEVRGVNSCDCDRIRELPCAYSRRDAEESIDRESH